MIGHTSRWLLYSFMRGTLRCGGSCCGAIGVELTLWRLYVAAHNLTLCAQRGWPIFETGVATEGHAKAARIPRLKARLAGASQKLVDIDERGECVRPQ